MEVILLERITRLGGMGEIVKVRDGYGRNFLIPMKKAMRATTDSKKLFEERRHLIEEQNAKAKAEAEKIAKGMEGLSVSIVRQAGQEGKLYGSVSIRDVADALKAAGHDVPKSQIVITQAIKNIGEYPVKVTLHAEVVATITVNVARVENDAA